MNAKNLTLLVLAPTTILGFASLSAAAPAEIINSNTRRGMFSSFPMAMSVHGNTGLLRKHGGEDPNGQPIPMPFPAGAANGADWGALADLGGTSAVGQIDFDAFSTGNGAFPPADLEGRINPTNSARWFGLSISIEADSEGYVSGSHYAESGVSPGAQIPTYYFPGSLDIDEKLVGHTLFEMGSVDMGFTSGGTEDVSAMDYGLAFLYEQGGTVTNKFFSEAEEFYFSVTQDWATNNSGLTTFALNAAGGFEPPHAANIYLAKWQNNVWSTPEVYMTYTELGLHSFGDLDALEVNPGHQRVLYSGTEGSINLAATAHLEDDEIMYFQRGGLMPRVAKDMNGQSVSSQAGVGNNSPGNNVDAICGIDPEMAGSYYREFAIPTDHSDAYGDPMGFSMSRTREFVANTQTGTANGPESLFIQLSGWGSMTEEACFVYLLRTSGPIIEGQTDLKRFSGWQLVGPRVIRQANDPTLTWELPVTSGGIYSYIAVSVTGNPNNFGASFATTIHL